MTVGAAFYASNVFHYHHVVEAMREVADEVTLASRFEVSPHLAARIERLPLPDRLKSTVRRRVVEKPIGLKHVGIGAAQFLYPLMGRVDAINTLPAVRFTIDQQSRVIARKVKDRHELFQFMEGMGHRTLEHGFSGVAICERRHFHHEVLEGDPGHVGDFPFEFRPDPIGDFLDFEYERADVICVYSDVARASFLQRGYSPDKVVVTPLGFPALTYEDDAEPREPTSIAYVGRCDAFKGIDVAVAAIAELGPPYRLHVAGHATAKVCEWLIAQPQVTYHGILGARELTALYRRSAILIAPSIESFGYAALEGAGHGARLICSAQTGAREFLPQGTHTVVEGRDPAVWGQAVLDASLWEPDLTAIRDALSRLNWANSARYSAEVMRTALARRI